MQFGDVECLVGDESMLSQQGEATTMERRIYDDRVQLLLRVAPPALIKDLSEQQLLRLFLKARYNRCELHLN